jgi:nucleotide-sensitive chloride channel 1A
MPAVNPINALPSFTSLEENKNILASTPNSFQDIPPVLRHREDNVYIALDPALEGFSAEDAAQGTLYVLTRYFLFIYKLIIKIHCLIVS